MATFVRHPIAYFAGLLFALRLARWNLRTAAYMVAYFLEAVVVGHMAEDLGVSHIHTHFSSTVAAICQRVFGFSISMTIHGPAEFGDIIGFNLREKVSASKFVVTISNFGKSQVMYGSNPSDWGKIEVCRLGVDTSRFVPRPHRATSDFVNLITVGRLDPVKAQRVLIEAAEQLANSGRRFHLKIVGPGPDHDALADLIRSRNLQAYVSLAGAVNQDELMRLYEVTDIFVLASFAEGVPVVLMEAMAREIPCVATWVNGVPELIENGTSGYLVPPSNAAGIAAGIAALIDDEQLRARIGAAGRKRVLQDYDLVRNVTDLAVIFRRHLAPPR
ncbi:MAG TPA: glycosyltransferase family 4 protein [Pirellulaceae bacterium]|nr:glycosyltransferase family 4 protein [Pirellulaceae bacterium]